MKTKRCIKCLQEKPVSEFYYKRTDCKLCNNIKTRNFLKQQHILYPWKRHFMDIKHRCNYTKFIGYKYYGGRGIKCLITEKEIAELWLRYEAFKMKCPSVDRKDNDGNYTVDNCKFIELVKNIRKAHSVPIIQYSKDNVYIREWESLADVTRQLGISTANICNVLKNKRISAGGFKWKYRY